MGNKKPHELDSDTLIKVYLAATKLGLEEEFIALLVKEIESRGIQVEAADNN